MGTGEHPTTSGSTSTRAPCWHLWADRARHRPRVTSLKIALAIPHHASAVCDEVGGQMHFGTCPTHQLWPVQVSARIIPNALSVADQLGLPS